MNSHKFSQNELKKISNIIFYDQDKANMWWNELIKNNSEEFKDFYLSLKNLDNINVQKISTFHSSIFSYSLVFEKYEVLNFLIDEEKMYISQNILEHIFHTICLYNKINCFNYIKEKLKLDFNHPKLKPLIDLTNIQRNFWFDYLSYNFSHHRPEDIPKNLTYFDDFIQKIPFYPPNYDDSKDSHYYQLSGLINKRKKYFEEFDKNMPFNYKLLLIQKFCNHFINHNCHYDCLKKEFETYSFFEIINKQLNNLKIANNLKINDKIKNNKI